MIAPPFSLKTSLILTIVLMGLLGLSLALFSSSVYRDVVLDNKRDSLSELVGIKTHDLLKALEQHSRDLGNSLRTSTKFSQALANNDTDRLSRLLEQQFHQYFVTANVLKLERLVVYSNNFDILATSTAEQSGLAQTASVCPAMLQQAAQRNGAARLRILSALCEVDGRPYHTVLLPLGGLLPKGYLQIATDPTVSLIPAGNALGMPIQVCLPDGKALYRSNDWPSATNAGLVAKYRLKTTQGKPALGVEVYDDIRTMYQELLQTRNTILVSSVILLGLVILMALFLLRRTLIHPLEVLSSHLQWLHDGKKLLGKTITTRSNIIEVNQLVDDFNLMTAELHNLYGRLERMAYTDSMTRLPNRVLFNDYVDYLLSKYSNSGRRFALFLIDLDEFKIINDAYGHETGDKLLCEVATRMNTVLRTPYFSNKEGISLIEIASNDLLVRLGGDEFAVVLPDITSNEQVNAAALKLIESTRQPIILYDNPVTVNLSIGITIYPDHGNGRTSLLRRADAAMYHAKNHSLEFCFYQPKMSSAGRYR